jgi:hypothetical protein
MNLTTFSSKPASWFKTKVFLSFLCVLPTIGNAVPFDNTLIRANLNGDYELLGDIDLSGYANWDPIGSENRPFTGRFNGNGYTIRGLTFTSSNAKHVGFFGYIAGAKIENLKVEVTNNSPIELHRYGEDQSFGVLAGYSNGAHISRVTVSSPSVNPLTINRSGHSGTYACNLSVGGVVGSLRGGDPHHSASIERSASTISFNAKNTDCGFHVVYAGGIAGYSEYFTKVENSYSTGDISATGRHIGAGGIVGFALSLYSTVSKSYASGAILANSSQTVFAGGIVGYTQAGGISNSAALNPSVAVIGSGSAHRIANDRSPQGRTPVYYYTNNIAYDNLATRRNGGREDEDLYKNEANGQGGLNRTLGELQSQWTYGALGWDFYSIWEWDYVTKRPVLR